MIKDYVVDLKQLDATILVQLKSLTTGELIESLEVPGTGVEGMIRAVKLGDQLLKQKESLPPASK